MSKLLRYFEPGQTVFVTAVTFDRNPLLSGNEDLLVSAFHDVFGRELSSLRAWVILTDHFHAVFESEGGEVPNMIRRIKLIFGSAYRSRHKLFRATVCQRRYWDHIIRDERDLRNHTDYVHYNPVKHGYALSPFDIRILQPICTLTLVFTNRIGDRESRWSFGANSEGE